MNANERELELVHYALPLDFGFLEIQEDGQFKAGGFEVVYALCNMLVREALGAFKFDYELILHENVGKIVAHVMPLVDHRERRLTSSLQSARKEFAKERSFVHLLKVSSPKYIRHFVRSTDHLVRQGFAFICVYLRQTILLPELSGLLT